MSEPTIIATIEKSNKESVVVTLSTYRQSNRIDVRTFGNYDGEGLRPTKKGVSLDIAHLPELLDAVTRATDEACRLGLLKDGGDL